VLAYVVQTLVDLISCVFASFSVCPSVYPVPGPFKMSFASLSWFDSINKVSFGS